ncbi:MAG: cation transporter [Candidatus Obscuribacterales bacterium]|nr:cation transporter [Candidatus Obscuribacterales bacterium]
MTGRFEDKARNVLVGLFVLLAFTPGNAQAEPDKADFTKTDRMVSRASASEKTKAKVDAKNLTRLDFRVEGSSCASCLGRIRKRIAKVKGVLDVAIAVKKPYGCAVIYDSSKTNKDEIIDKGKEGEKEKVKILDISDEHIAKMPFILVPKFNQLR